MDSQFPHRASLRDFLYILFKRKLQILLFFFATICLVGNANDKRVGLPLPDLCSDAFPVRLLIDGLEGDQW